MLINMQAAMPILEQMQHQHPPPEPNPHLPPPLPHQGFLEHFQVINHRLQEMQERQEQFQLQFQGMQEQFQGMQHQLQGIDQEIQNIPQILHGLQEHANAVSTNSFYRGMNSQAGTEDDLLPLFRELPAQGPPPLPQQNQPLPPNISFPIRKIRCAHLTSIQLNALAEFYGVVFAGNSLERRRVAFMAYIGLR